MELNSLPRAKRSREKCDSAIVNSSFVSFNRGLVIFKKFKKNYLPPNLRSR
jgi:hypothetical protein